MARPSNLSSILINNVFLLAIAAGAFVYVSEQFSGLRRRIDKLEGNVAASGTNADYARENLERKLQGLEDELVALRLKDVVYFPPGAFGKGADRDASSAAELAAQLRALKADSMWARAERKDAGPVVRLLWLPAKRRTAALRVLPPSPRSTMSTLEVVQLGEPGVGRGRAGKLVTKNIGYLDEHHAVFAARLSETGFWSAPAVTELPDAAGKDRWLLEGVQNGRYHLLAGNTDDPVFRKVVRILLDTAEAASGGELKLQGRAGK